MNVTENQFRTAAFGGFQKQDVLNYIESTSRTRDAREEALQKEVDALQKGRKELEKQAAECAELLSELTLEKERLATELAEKTAALETTQALHAKSEVQTAEYQNAIVVLTQKLTKAEPDAAAYQSIKDRTAGVELEAHCRARAIEVQAEEKAKQVQQDLEDWFCKVRTGYDRMRTDIDTTITHVAGELERVNESLGGVRSEFSEHDTALVELQEVYRAVSAPKVPEPLSLEG